MKNVFRFLVVCLLLAGSAQAADKVRFAVTNFNMSFLSAGRSL